MQVAASTKAGYEAFVAHFYQLSVNIGIAPACRALGLNLERGKKIAQRRRFNIGLLRPPTRAGNAPEVPNVPSCIEATNQVVQHYGDRAKIGAVIAGSKALEHLADCEGSKLVTPAAAISGDQWTKAVDRAAGWTQARAAGVNVGVQVNITPPSAEERAERRAVHASLDAITKLLQSPKET